MRDDLKRVNIVLTKDLLKQMDEEKDSHHGSRSQLIRQALFEYFDGLNGGDGSEGEEHMRSLFREVRELESEIKKIGEKVNREIGSTSDGRSDIREVAEDVESLLLEVDEPLSIPEMGEYLPYEQKQLLQGVERLEDTLKVKRLEQGNGLTKWAIRGYKNVG